MLKKIEFTNWYSDGCRVRHTHICSYGKILEFILQLEINIEGKWYPIVRYDTSHGFAHRDYCHPDGSTEKTPLFVSNYNEALTFAQEDINLNWELYSEHFLKEVNKYGKRLWKTPA